MKKNIMLIILLVGFLVFPFNTYARELDIAGEKYNVNYYLDVLKDEGIEPTVPDFNEGKDKVNIYLFYGKGCEYCDSLLNFLNSITPEYKDYFNVVGFEIYGDEKNSKLLKVIANTIEAEDDGVPLIFVGDKYFSGYSVEYDDLIKEAIKNNYEIDPDEREDIISSYASSRQEQKKTNNTNKVIIYDFVFTAIATIIIIIFINYKFSTLTVEKKK